MQSQGMTSKIVVKVKKKLGFENRRKEDQGHIQYANSSSEESRRI